MSRSGTTNEPAPTRRYVVLYHETPVGAARDNHWDLMLETGRALRTWALSCEPRDNVAIDAEQLADHRVEYLDYEGPISGDRGSVTRWDAGTFEIVSETDIELVLELCGQRLMGRAMLRHEVYNESRWVVRFFSPA